MATTMVFVENTSYQGYFRVKSVVWVGIIKRIVSVKFDIWRFLLTKPVYFLTKLKSHGALKKISTVLAAIRTTKKPVLQRQKKIYLCYNLAIFSSGYTTDTF